MDETMVNNNSGMAMNNFTVEFFGKAAHGAFDPWNGRSAVDAVEMLDMGINMMREHIEPTARIHNVITSGGEAPNVVPAYARSWYYVRDSDREKVEKNYAWILDIVKGAALATQTDYKVSLVAGVHEMLLNRPLQEAMQAHLETVGGPQFGEAEQQFARDLQAFLEIDAVGLDSGFKPLEDKPEPPSGGSTDVAEISWKVPTVSLYAATSGTDLPWHSWATSASHGLPGAARGAQVATRVLALTGMQMLTDKALMERAWEVHRQATAEKPYVSPIPLDQAPPLPEGD